MTHKNYYQLLGLEAGASEDEIKRAYRRLALKYHPDKNQEPGAEEVFKNISEAYEVLSDKDKKRVYDSYGVDGLNRNKNGYRHQHSGFNSAFFHPRDPFDIFKTFFGSFDSFHGHGFHHQTNNNSGGGGTDGGHRFSSRDPFENFFQNHSNLHRRFFNSPFHSAPNVFSFTPMFQKSSFEAKPQGGASKEASKDTSTPSHHERAQAPAPRKCSVETKTGEDGTVHITKTIIEQDGKVRREIRFRSPSANRNCDDDISTTSAANLRREQTEPSMKYRNVLNDTTTRATFKTPGELKEEINGDLNKTKTSDKPKLQSVPMKTNFSTFYSAKDKENRPATPQTPRSKARKSSSSPDPVGSKKPPKVSSARTRSSNPRYLQATEASLRRSSIAEDEDLKMDPKKTSSSSSPLRSSHSRLVMCNLCYRNFGRSVIEHHKSHCYGLNRFSSGNKIAKHSFNTPPRREMVV